MDEESTTDPKVSTRELIADEMPFILRAWWMRDFAETADLSFFPWSNHTRPLYCLHSDPLCDAGNIEFNFQ